MEQTLLILVVLGFAAGTGAYFFVSKGKRGTKVMSDPPKEERKTGIKPVKANVAKTAQLSALQQKLASAASNGKMIVPNAKEAEALLSDQEPVMESSALEKAPVAKEKNISVSHKEEESSKETVSSDKKVGAKTLIMLVDDSKVVRIRTEKLLSEEGYKIISAVDGIDALSKLDDVMPELIITDIEMPNLDGFGLVRNLRNNLKTSDIPIIVMTSHVNLHLDIAATEGINGFLPKPFNEDDLVEQVRFLVS